MCFHRLKIVSGLILCLVAIPAAAVTDFAARQGLLNKLNKTGQVRVIVTFKSDTEFQAGQTSRAGRSLAMPLRSRQDALLARLPKARLKHTRRFEHVPQMALTVEAQELQQLLQDPDIQVAENKLHKPLLAQSVPRVFSSHNSTSYTGNNWAVAVLDTGVDKNHGFIAGKVVSEACYSTNYLDSFATYTSLCPGKASNSTANGSGNNCSGIEGCEHGTAVAGVVAGNGGSFDGVARNADIIAIKVFTKVEDFSFCGSFDPCLGAADEDIIAGLERVYQLRNSRKIAAVNLSLGSLPLHSGSCNNDPKKLIIDDLKGANIATVVASGNDWSSSQMRSPACVSSAIAVGSTSDSDTPSNFSNSSPVLDLYAPGENIYTSVPGGYLIVNGTSFAAPHVAGAWAVLRQASPNSSVDQIEGVLKSSGPTITKGDVTRRRLNVTAALDNLAPIRSGNGANIAPILQLLLLDG